MGRYLMFLSYIGTHYRGLQVQNVRGIPRPDVKTVCGVLQKHLQQLQVSNEVKLVTSSRTDADVHALCNTLHFDLIHRKHPDREYNPDLVKMVLNQKLKKDNERIRIHKILRVSDDFHCRHRVVWRQYLYRLAVLRSECDGEEWGIPLSVMEADRCHFIRGPFDLPLFLEAAAMLSGTNNFGAFTTINALRKEPNKTPVRTLSVGVTRGRSQMGRTQPWLDESYDFWDIHFQAGGFLYRQVRRMVGAMINVAQNKLTLDDLQALLQLPVSAFMPWLKDMGTESNEHVESSSVDAAFELDLDQNKSPVDSSVDSVISTGSSSDSIDAKTTSSFLRGSVNPVNSVPSSSDLKDSTHPVAREEDSTGDEVGTNSGPDRPGIEPETLLSEKDAKNVIRIQGVPGYGLYLRDVVYRPEDVVYRPGIETSEKSGSEVNIARETTPTSLDHQELSPVFDVVQKLST